QVMRTASQCAPGLNVICFPRASRGLAHTRSPHSDGNGGAAPVSCPGIRFLISSSEARRTTPDPHSPSRHGRRPCWRTLRAACGYRRPCGARGGRAGDGSPRTRRRAPPRAPAIAHRGAHGSTEQYWCPIKHAIRVRATHEHYRTFVDYGEAETYRERLEELRRELEKLKVERIP